MIIEQCNTLDERCPEYRDVIVETITDIIEYERQHRVQGTNIQIKINEKCNAAGRYLAEHRGQLLDDGGE